MIVSLLLTLAVYNLDPVLDVPELKGAVYSATVQALDGTVLYERNTDLRVVPASNQKLISCAYALATLGPDFVPKTKIWKQSDRIVVESMGDPSLTYAQLFQARKDLHLDGRLPVYVKQAYRIGVPDSWEVDDLPNRYAAKVTEFCFDQSAFEVWSENGRPKLIPGSFGVKLVRDKSLGSGKTVYDPLKKILRYSPTLPKSKIRLDTLALPDPDEAAASVLGRRFYPVTTVPSRAPDLVIKGKPLPEILKTCLVNSDNNMAENLMLMATAKREDISDDPYGHGRERVENFLFETVGVDPADIRYFDGSGMSRHNLVTSRAIAKLLQWANNQPTAPLWKSCLASPESGTLKTRLKGIDFHGKTGTLDMVVSLSGYVKNAKGEAVIASLLLNHFKCSSVKARDIADAFMKSIAETNDGPSVALFYGYEPRHSDPLNPLVDWNWFGGSDHHGGPSRSWSDRGTQPTHAGLY